MSNVATGSSLLTVDKVKKLNREQLNEYLRRRLKDTNNINKHANTITVDQEVDGSNFLDLTRDDLLAIKIPLGPAKDIEKVINEIKGGQPTAVSTSRINTGHVHVFVDNSNLYVEGKYSVGQLENIYDKVKVINEDTKVEEYRQVYYMRYLKIDYGFLLTTILRGRSMGSSPIIVGSRPPSDDTLWNKVKSLGYEVTVYDRNNENREKRVDMKLGISMVIETLLKAKGPGVLVLIAGDGDYEPALGEILKAGWKVEIRFWASAISRYLKTPDIARKNKEFKVVYEPLDKEYQNFTFCVGPDLTKNKSVFRIEREDMNHNWSSEEIMKCYTELQLFCWWYVTDDEALELYFKSKAQLERADRWMMKNFPNVKAWKMRDMPDELHELPN